MAGSASIITEMPVALQAQPRIRPMPLSEEPEKGLSSRAVTPSPEVSPGLPVLVPAPTKGPKTVGARQQQRQRRFRYCPLRNHQESFPHSGKGFAFWKSETRH
jgi:hypothetical protein